MEASTAAGEQPQEEKVEGWNVLVVDDDPDVHTATTLALKRKMWRKRPFVIRSVYSAKEARDLLRQPEYRNHLHVAMIDVVMETRFAGLDLCRFIRSELPRSARIILRTGQPGVAPEERVINDYDIDYYFAKPEATPDRLYTALRACLRSSQDIETLLAFGNQLRSFTTALQKATSREDLATFMRVGLDFLELKHSARIIFVPDIDTPDDSVSPTSAEFQALARAHSLQLEPGKIHPASSLGIDEDWFVLAFHATGKTSAKGGFVIQRMRSLLHGLQSDLLLFLQNWTIAWANCVLTLELAEERKLLELKVEERTRELSQAYENLEKVFKELESRDEVITQDLMQAREFQQSILTKPPDISSVSVEIVYRPVDLVGGDLYDVATIGPGLLRIFLADATGHGVRAALTTMFIKSEYEAIKQRADGPAAVLRALNERIAGTYGLLGMRFTAVCAVIDLGKRVVRWSSGGHLESFLHSCTGDVRVLDGAGPFMGVVPDIVFGEWEAPFTPGDCVVFYTDGITEATNEKSEAFGEERLAETIRSGAVSKRPLGAALSEHLDRFLEGRPPQDDVTFVAISSLTGAEHGHTRRPLVDIEIGYDWQQIEAARGAISTSLAGTYGEKDLRDSVLMVATELLENAVKYGKPDGGIHLRITEEDDRIVISATSGLDEAGASAAVLEARLKWLRSFPTPMEAFLAASAEVAGHREHDKSGLGLARIEAEGECTLEHEVAGNRLTLRATHVRQKQPG